MIWNFNDTNSTNGERRSYTYSVCGEAALCLLRNAPHWVEQGGRWLSQEAGNRDARRVPAIGAPHTNGCISRTSRISRESFPITLDTRSSTRYSAPIRRRILLATAIYSGLGSSCGVFPPASLTLQHVQAGQKSNPPGASARPTQNRASCRTLCHIPCTYASN